MGPSRLDPAVDPPARQRAYREVVRRAELIRRYAFDAFVVALAVLIQIEIAVTEVPGLPAVLVPAGLLYTLPLLLRRTLPFLAPSVAFVVHSAISFTDPQAVGGFVTGELALGGAFWVAGAWNRGTRAVAGLILGLSTLAVIAATDDRVGPAEMLNGWLLGTTTWGVALLLQERARRVAAAEERAARVEHERNERTQQAVAEERGRIARELHDVVAHSVSVMTVQAGAARVLLTNDPQRAAEPLRAVEETGHQAMTELRRLLGILRAEERPTGPYGEPSPAAPQPGVDDLPALVDSYRGAGLPVELTIRGQPRALPPGVALAAYRIVQEALTNSLKHAAAARAAVTLTYGTGEVEVEVIDDGRGGAPTGRGHGLLGMAERASVFGGQLVAGPLGDGGFAVRARLPYETVRSP